MKFVFVAIFALVVVAVNGTSSPQCNLCNKYVAFLSTHHTEQIPQKYSVFETTGNFEKLCLACNRGYEFDNEANTLSNELQNEQEDEEMSEYVQQDDDQAEDEEEVEEARDEFDATNLVSLTNCKTCHAIVEFTAKNSHDFNYATIKAALSHACSSHKIKWLNDARCRLFIATRKEKIINSILRYHMDSTTVCLHLEQC